MNRRNFIKQSAAIAATGTLLQQCTLPNKHVITGKIMGANAAAGHLLRDGKWQEEATETIQTGTIIIGGGISGLSAARWLHKHGEDNFMLLEMDTKTGGNAASGSNEVSAYPWGAHYIPIPNNDLPELNSFLQECNVITGYNSDGQPLINEYYLCFAPQERLYINGYWQEGLVPDFGVPQNEREEIKRFFDVMQNMRNAKGSDGKFAFTIPAGNSSNDDQFIQLDNKTMKQWFEENNFLSPYLHWYINYCCRDDFGTDYSKASAWAGIHYFAARKGTAANAASQSVITWPEGNTWLVNHLKKDIGKNIHTGLLAVRIMQQNEEVKIIALDTATRKTKNILAKKCIVATPQFVTARLLDYDEEKKKNIASGFNYQPWMVANITVQDISERSGASLCWDNVLYKGTALGYVEATHQQLKTDQPKKVLTYYLPLTEKDAITERQSAHKRSYEEWVNIILKDLAPVHEDIAAKAVNIDIWIWGHGMISPVKGFIHGTLKKQLQQPFSNQILFAHTDLSGISIFEEAFYQGIKAAEQILKPAAT